MQRSRFLSSARSLSLIALTATTGALAGCAEAPSDEYTANEIPLETGATDSDDCLGVRVVVEYGALGGAPAEACAESTVEITAAEAFTLAGFELTEGLAFPGAFCRVNGVPDADTELTFNGERYTEDCAALGPAWAYWGLFVDLGDGWAYAEEGAATQPVAPGQSVAFAWQFGDTTVPQFPTV